MKTQILIDNLKCGGCAGTIKKGIRSFPEVSDVTVDVEKDLVEVTYSDVLLVEKIKEKLVTMGYPEKGSLTGLHKLTANAKSYVSCAIGKISKED
jgi:copper chaperone